MAETPDTTAPAAWIPGPIPPTPSPTDATFGGRLALLRHHMGWNVKEAARECGLPAATWRLWEDKGALPRNIVTIAMTIAGKTNCDLDWLVFGPDRKGTALSGRYGQQTVIARIGALAERSTGSGPKHGPVTYRPVRQTQPVGGVARRPFTPTAV